MATDEKTKVPGGASFAEKIQDRFLTCPICYEIFEQPKCLPCLHTFCYHCLGSYIESREHLGAKRKMGFPCPICKQFYFVKLWTKPLSEWVDDIQNNFYLQNMIESLVPESKSTSPAPESSSLSSGDTKPTSIASAASTPPPEPVINPMTTRKRALPSAPSREPELNPMTTRHRAVPSASPPEPELNPMTTRHRAVPTAPPELNPMTTRHRAVPSTSPSNPSPGYSRLLTFPGFHYDIRSRRYVPDEPVHMPDDPVYIPDDPVSAEYQSTWGILNTGCRPAPEVMRPSRSTTDLSANTNKSPTAKNMFRNRCNSSNDLNRRETVALFTETTVPWHCTYKRNFYCKKPQFSDVCCLPKQMSVVATDYNKRKVVLYENLFHRTYSIKKIKVGGRPCSIALLDEKRENCVVVNLQNKAILIFISVPDMEILRKVETGCNYRSAAALSPDTLLAGSADRPASIDLIKIDHDYKLILRPQVLIKNGKAWDLSSPDHICVLSPTCFMVSDSEKKSIICYDIVEDHDSRTRKAVKRFSLAPTADRKFQCPGGLFFDRSSQSVYTVDYGNHSVLRVVPGDTLLCETLLTGSDDVFRPASVCLGPQNQLCVVDWEGHISLYEQSTNRV